jgi:DNA helicase-2/ATP-dependent DNA helicase PcrA
VEELDLLQVIRGRVVAPAGCGKTHLIMAAARNNSNPKPLLILTHTNAGVAALRQRMHALEIHHAKYKLMTLDGWALRVVNMFPGRAGYTDGPNPPQLDYASIRESTLNLLRGNHLNRIIPANYCRLIVDEYQDCGVLQHEMVSELANLLPTCILGDPMQGIFNWPRSPSADWDNVVCPQFPLFGELATPWRWNNVGNPNLGNWLLGVRQILMAGQNISLTGAPTSVRWIELSGNQGQDRPLLINAARCPHKQAGDKTLIIGDSMNAASRYNIAKSIPGIITIEPVSLKDMIDYSGRLRKTNAVPATLSFAESMITNVGRNEILKRMETIKAKRNRTPPTEVEIAAIRLEEHPSLMRVANLLSACTNQAGSRTYRPRVLRASLKALNLAINEPKINLLEAATRVREENRAVGRQLPNNAIGSTLLLKGLESDHVIVLNAGDLDAKNLYVAMTRGAKSVTLCSPANTFGGF